MIPDYSSNFTTLAAGLSGLDTKAGNLLTNNTNLMTKLTALENKVNALSNSSGGNTPAGKFNVIDYQEDYAGYHTTCPTFSITSVRNNECWEIQATCTVPIYNNWDVVTSNKGLYIKGLYVNLRGGCEYSSDGTSYVYSDDLLACTIEDVYVPVNKTVRVNAKVRDSMNRNCFVVLKNTGTNLTITQCYVTGFRVASYSYFRPVVSYRNFEGDGVRGDGYYY